MASYVIPPDGKKKRKSMLTGYVYILISLTILILTISLDERKTLIRISNTVLFVNFCWVGVDKIRNAEKGRSLQVDAETIRFNQRFNLRHYTEISWADIRWMKRETNNAVSFFQASSFSKVLDLADFSETDRENILEELQMRAKKRSIRLINFSDPLLGLV